MPLKLSMLTAACCQLGATLVISVAVLNAFGSLDLAQVQSGTERRDAPDWRKFTSRAGWTLEYPSDLTISSCRQCTDPTDPNVFVAFSRRSGEVIALIEPLADKIVSQSSRQWLSDVARDTILSPILSKEWVSTPGALELVVVNGDSKSDKSENVYILHGVKTLAVRIPHVQDIGVRSISKRMLSTFKFTGR